MSSDRNGDSSPDTLNGWKDIAAFLGKSVRTAQRWERELGLPTHRIKTQDGQIIFGKRSEIDAWRSSMDQRRLGLADDSADDDPPGDHAPVSPVEPSNAPSRIGRRIAWVAGTCAAIGIGALGMWLLQSRSRPLAPTTLRFVGHALQAVDSTGALVWSHPFESDVSAVLDPVVSVARADINGDGELEDLVPVRYGRPGERVSSKGDALMAFASNGRVLWTVASNRIVSCGGEDYAGPWGISAILVSHDGTPARVWVAFSEPTWWPSFVVEILPDGTQVPRYLQTGWIMSLAQLKTPSGTWGVAGGVMNEYSRGSIAFFDLNGPEQILPAVDRKFACAISGPHPPPQRVALLPNFEVPQTTGNGYVIVEDLQGFGTGLRATSNAGTVAMIAADGTITDLSANDGYWFAHAELEGVHRLTHTIASCPDLTKPKEVRYWTPADGWRSAAIMMKSRQAAVPR